MRSAFYDFNFNECEILKPLNLREFVIIKHESGCDLVDESIEEFVFADCVKNFSELTVSESNNLFDGLNIKDEIIKSLKIIIKGYNESTDSINFDLDKINLNAPYRYAITSNGFEMSMTLNEKADRVIDFLRSIECSFDDGCKHDVLIYINDEILCSNANCDKKVQDEDSFTHAK
ncbi:hypothetical protein CCAL9344_03955 [Campylobacter sp. RM9344]|uniref:Uncharacterized protein n=1 Tax=Campylobacter californiensis TaxID=1032243 RepID=A0AAW3ZT54_9BACT|nr:MULTISPECIES: DUF5416 family protein [unclassified Campylobacter]MBE2984902.1 hypothetical protein [Campylobacter sp. RM6883]MBE2986335.1 hypothetical protein [Campylobacter sp. RM12919]MBE2988034.1 hypothetical protein [Campylobacter sp. RM12920]MBE2995322.1 hypothetical protein [Campylobacter sp. RM6913]MBE3022407.1 hypothetical protein [Campylobacter sp. 7477a]MBE3029343.1 hypothetical protein [Campylobacter sp. RM9344]